MKQVRLYKRAASGPALKLALAVAAALMTNVSGAHADEAQARAILKAMTDYLRAQSSLSFNVDSSVEVVTTGGQKLAIASSGSVAMKRPDKVHVLRQGGFATIETIFDGKVLSVLNRDANLYGQSDLSGTVDQLIETLHDEYHRPLPAADLLSADPGAVLLADVTEVSDLGSGVIRGEECDHLAFRSPDIDWQVWIAQGDVPHPCRFVITSKTTVGWPEYTLEFSAWGNGAVQPDFTFKAPAGAKKTDIEDIPDLDEVAGIFVVKGGN